jgi:uncharacterized Zn finger protein
MMQNDLQISISFQSVVQSVKVIIPNTAQEIVGAVKDINDGFINIFQDPKTSLFKIGSAVIRYKS